MPMDLAAPELLWLLAAVPLVAAVGAWVWRRRLQAAAAWASRGLWDRLLPTFSRRRLVASVALLALACAAATLALGRPRWGASAQQVERQGVDVVFVLDTSLSMATRDLAPTRLAVAQTLVRELVRELPGHRVALVQAEGDGGGMVPLTADAAVVALVLDAVQPGSLPMPGTELAPSLGRALELFPDSSDKHRVMIVLSDGEDHGEGLQAMAEELRDAGVVTHAVGVGTREGKPLELPMLEPGQKREYKRDDAGQVVYSRLVEENLEGLTRATGGVYLRARSAATDTLPIRERIESMEKRSYGAETVELLEERFQWPLSLAILALTLHLGITPFRRPEEESP
ncbi:MAG: VWA domain-containing protein [Holophagales bacterium]|nr:VWA domain-containing protein [Holophagales bacterium]